MYARENCQTAEFCKKLGIVNPFCPPRVASSSNTTESRNPEEINLESSDSDDETRTNPEETKDDDDKTTPTLVGHSEEGVAWSVDRRPGLSLPPPTTSVDQVIAQTHAEVEMKEAGGNESQNKTLVESREESTVELHAKGSMEHSGDFHAANNKPHQESVVIKRRNQSMYTEDITD